LETYLAAALISQRPFFFSNQIHFVFQYLTQVSDGFIISHDFV
jgi:hypothetical protein